MRQDTVASLGRVGSFRRKMAAVPGSTPTSCIQSATPQHAGNLRRNSNCARDTAEKRHGRDPLHGSHPRHSRSPRPCPRVHTISRTGRNSLPEIGAASPAQSATFPPRGPSIFIQLCRSLHPPKSDAPVPLKLHQFQARLREFIITLLSNFGVGHQFRPPEIAQKNVGEKLCLQRP